MERADRVVIVTRGLLIGVHVGEARARQADHRLAVDVDLAGDSGKPTGQPVGDHALVLLIHQILLYRRLGVAMVDVVEHLLPAFAPHVLGPELTRRFDRLEEGLLVGIGVEHIILAELLNGRLRHLVGGDERIHGLAEVGYLAAGVMAVEVCGRCLVAIVFQPFGRREEQVHALNGERGHHRILLDDEVLLVVGLLPFEGRPHNGVLVAGHLVHDARAIGLAGGDALSQLARSAGLPLVDALVGVGPHGVAA